MVMESVLYQDGQRFHKSKHAHISQRESRMMAQLCVRE